MVKKEILQKSLAPVVGVEPFWPLLIKEVGARDVLTRQYSKPHDIITFLADRRSIISEKCFNLHQKDYSYLEIAREVGVPKDSVAHYIKSHFNSMKGAKKFREIKTRGTKTLKTGHAPYGYWVIHKRLVDHPKEQAVVQLIKDLWNKGEGATSIAKTLNVRGIKSRKNLKWRHKTITSIIKRTKTMSVKTLKARSK